MDPKFIVSGDDYLSLPRAPQTWIVEPLLPTGGSMMVYGDPKVGKSYAALQLASKISTGGDWLGFPVRQSGIAVYVQLDTPRSLWATRVEQLARPHPDVRLVQQTDRELLDAHPFDVLNPLHFDRLRGALKELDPLVVVIDTLREAHQGDENSSQDMQRVTSALEALTTPAAMILVHHSKKPSENGASLINDMRGGYSAGRMDAILRFTHKTLYFTGRSVEEGSIKLRREDDGFWVPDQSEIDLSIKSILNDPAYKSTRQQAVALSQRIGKGEEACRSLLRRAIASGTTPTPTTNTTAPPLEEGGEGQG